MTAETGSADPQRRPADWRGWLVGGAVGLVIDAMVNVFSGDLGHLGIVLCAFVVLVAAAANWLRRYPRSRLSRYVIRLLLTLASTAAASTLVVPPHWAGPAMVLACGLALSAVIVPSDALQAVSLLAFATDVGLALTLVTYGMPISFGPSEPRYALFVAAGAAYMGTTAGSILLLTRPPVRRVPARDLALLLCSLLVFVSGIVMMYYLPSFVGLIEIPFGIAGLMWSAVALGGVWWSLVGTAIGSTASVAVGSALYAWHAPLEGSCLIYIGVWYLLSAVLLTRPTILGAASVLVAVPAIVIGPVVWHVADPTLGAAALFFGLAFVGVGLLLLHQEGALSRLRTWFDELKQEAPPSRMASHPAPRGDQGN